MVDGSRRWLRLAAIAAIAVGIVARLTLAAWDRPWEPHHPDEHILPLEALALWEGVTPREVGWPASTTRIALSGIAAAQWLVERGDAAWRLRRQPDRALETVTTWIAQQYVAPASLYKLGRATSILTGILLCFAVAWTLTQWVGPIGVAVGTLAVAIAPLAVTYSQYVLADITGVLFATIMLGLAGQPTSRRVVAMGVLCGLAMSSKFHFGIWLLTPLLSIWLRPDTSAAEKGRVSLYTLGVAVWVVVTLVPWFWVNPLLALKEFAGVVLVKVGNGALTSRIFGNTATVYEGLGVLTWAGALVGAGALFWKRDRRFVPLLGPVLAGTAALVTSGTVFDRYGLVLLPGLAILAAWGWESSLGSGQQRTRALAVGAVGLSTIVTLTGLARAEQLAGDADVDVLAQHWILANVPRGSHIALYDENNAFLPRAAVQLQECVDREGTSTAYREKWLVQGVEHGVDGTLAMRSMVLNDENFIAYWCRREMDVQKDPGFYIVPYHNEPRFGAVLERDAINEFQTGARVVTGGVDVLVMNRAIDGAATPGHVVRTARGQRVIYSR